MIKSDYTRIEDFMLSINPCVVFESAGPIYKKRCNQLYFQPWMSYCCYIFVLILVFIFSYFVIYSLYTIQVDLIAN